MPLSITPKTIQNQCNAVGCSNPYENVAVRVASSGKIWAFAKCCNAHATMVNTIEDLSSMERTIKERNTGPVTLAHLAMKLGYCPHCRKSQVDWQNDGNSALPIGLWTQCECQKNKKPVEKIADAPLAEKKTETKNNNNTGETKMTKPMDSMSAFGNMFKTSGLHAAKRVASTQAIRALRAAIVKGLEAQGSDIATQGAMFLATPYGEAMLAMVAGVAMQQLAIPGVSDGVRGAVGEELVVQAMTTAGNELVSQFSGPVMEALASLSGPMEQVRVAMENEEKAVLAPPATEVEELEVAAVETAKSKLRAGKKHGE